jgi:hypothetical protein
MWYEKTLLALKIEKSGHEPRNMEASGSLEWPLTCSQQGKQGPQSYPSKELNSANNPNEPEMYLFQSLHKGTQLANTWNLDQWGSY